MIKRTQRRGLRRAERLVSNGIKWDSGASEPAKKTSDGSIGVETTPPPPWPRRLLLVGVVLFAIAAFVQACGGTAASTAVDSPAPSAAVDSPAPSAADGPSPAFEIVAENTAYDIDAITVPAGTPFTIMFTNKDLGEFHDIDIREVDKLTEIQGQNVVGGGESATYEYDGLPAGTYVFVCSVHVVPSMTGTLTVE